MLDGADGCLIGHTGFVGGNLARTGAFSRFFNSSNVEDMKGRDFPFVVCCGMPGTKWIANRDRTDDGNALLRLVDALGHIEARDFILVSTVDVYPTPMEVDEDTHDDGMGRDTYGENRSRLERFVRRRFPGALVVRLPALFGPGLRKNVLFDLLRGERLERIHPASSFQWYDVERLWHDIGIALAAGIKLANLVPEPLATRDIVEALFPGARVDGGATTVVAYDVRTRHSAIFGGASGYVEMRAETLSRMEAYVDAASRRIAAGGAP